MLRFADDDDDHPLGRLLTFQGGRFASSYRVKDGQITRVNRHMGRRNMTITVLDNDANADGQVPAAELPGPVLGRRHRRRSTGSRPSRRRGRASARGTSRRHTVTVSSDAGLSVRVVTLSGHEAAKGK